MIVKSLQDKIDQAGSPVKLLRDSSAGAATGPLTGGEFSNWRDEQLSWRETSALFDLSHHMTDVTVHGPDKLKVFSDLGVNSLANFVVGKAKQFVATNEDGLVIGDAILEYIDQDSIRLIGMPAPANWVQFHIETGHYDVTFSRDEPTAINPLGHPELYRYQVTGPTALEILQKATDGHLPDIKFFNAAMVTIAGRRVRALGHNMARALGLELTGPWAEGKQIRDALLEAGQEFGLKPNGSRAPTAGGIESGWLPMPMPAIFTGENEKAYRQWLPATGFEATASLGGSLASDEISDYYVTPRDLDYGKIVKFDHDFIGREALSQPVEGPLRRKVTLVWNTDDVARVNSSLYTQEVPFKYMELPTINYATWHYDKILVGEQTVGVSTLAAYTYNERKMLSLAVVDDDVKEGSEVRVVWGEEDGGSAKPQVERHVQTEIRAIVSKVPYSGEFNR